MTDVQNSPFESGLTLGQQLKQAREAQKLTIAEVAAKTNLKKSHIESLEDDIFILPNVPPAFMRGYVRNYVRFLRLPESLISSVNYGEVTIPKEVQKAATTIKPTSPKSQGRWVKYATFVVLLGALGMTLTWWWQNYQKDQEDRDQVVNTSSMTTQMENPNQLSLPIASNENVSLEASNSEATEPVSVDNQVNNVLTTAEEKENTTTTTLVETTPVVAEVVEESAQPETVEPTQTVVNTVVNDDLRIEITGVQSWITVRGDKNKRLAEKLYVQGETLAFNDNTQYRVTIGAPAYTKLYYKGQEVPMVLNGKVARLSCSEQCTPIR